ncbi:MAG: gliding motility-associated C-terminal domain-containing protein [Flavobacteriales bacterium]|nr:gliding motility-associated C-terminal domain-containing protein [Flavobacteriales bacterium]
MPFRFKTTRGPLPLLLLLALMLGTAHQCVAQGSEQLPTRGKRFWTGFMQNGFGAQSLKVHIMPRVATSGTVSIPLTGWSYPFSIAANAVAVIDVPLSAENIGSEAVLNKAVLVETSDSVNVFVTSFQNYTHDLTQVLPEQSIGTSYRVDAYKGLPNFNNLHRSELLIIATEDGTQVRITPTANTTGGRPAGVPFTVDLNAGQTYQVQALSDAADLTGTLIEGTDQSGPCRPFAVIGGSMCASVPSGCSACDAIFEQLTPRNTWGTRFFTVVANGTNSVTYRIMADQNGTVVTIGNGAPISLNAGQQHEVNGTNIPVCIQANRPISVAQFMEGYACAGNGDPSMIILSPDTRTTRSASFHTPSSAQINQHSITVVMPSGNPAPLLLNGNAVSPALFQSYPGCTDRVWAKVNVGQGINRLQSTAGFQAYMFGLGFGESYAASVNDIGSTTVTQDSLICGGGPITLNAPGGMASLQWTAASAPNVVLGSSATLQVQPTGNESYTVTGTQAVSGCPRSFTYHVGAPLTIPTSLTANGATTINVCQFQPVQLALVPPPSTAWFNIEWSPSATLDVSNPTAPVATPTATTWYRASVSSPVGCGGLVDSILVTVQPGAILDLETMATPATVCAGNTTQLGSRVLRTLAHDALNTVPSIMWGAIQGGTISTACSNGNDPALYFDGNGQRSAQTVAYNTIGGGSVRFKLKIANGTTPCDDADPGEDVLLEFTTNNGLSWNTIATYNESAYPSLTAIDAAIPAAAQGPNVMFRWRQMANSGAGQDNWMIDDVFIARFDATYASYSWSQAGTLNNATSAGPVATPTSSGWYVLTATDPVAGCQYRDSVWVQVAPVFTLTTTPSATLCSASGIQLNVTPSSGTGITYAWGPSNGNLNNSTIPNPYATPTQTTTYTVTATNANGCTATSSTTITVGQLSALNVSAASTTICQGQSVALSATVTGAPGMAITWTGAGLSSTTVANPTATPAQTTTYTCTATDNTSGCSLTQSITITVNGGYTANAGADLTLCTTLGHQLTVQHNVPNASFSWSPAGNLSAAAVQSPFITTNATATYTVTVSDPNGCSVSDEVVITRAFAGTPTTATASACAATPPTLNAPVAASSYQWSNGATTQSITPSNSGNYTVTMTDAQGCQASTTFAVTIFAMPVVNLGPDQSICGSSGVSLNAGNPGSGYLWSTGATTQSISATASGTYSVSVTNVNGCSSSDAIELQFNPMPSDQLQDVSSCITTPVILNAGNAGSSFSWSTGATTQTITPTASGTYTVTITSPANCSATFDATVTLLPALSVDLGPDTVLCAGSTITLDATSTNATYLWSNGATTPTITVGPGSYSVTVTNGACTSSDAITIVQASTPLDQLQDVSRCADQPITLDAGNAGSTYLWNTGATSASVTATNSGTYTVLVTNSSGCSATFDAVVNVIQPPTVYLGADTALCEGQVLVLDAGNPGSTYAWSNGSTGRYLNVSTAGTYSVSVNNGCVRNDAIAVFFNPSPVRMAVNEFHTCLDDAPRYVVIDAGNSGARHSWSTGANTQVILASAYGWYYVNVTNAYDCSARDSAQVIEYCPATIFIPNTFTPNGDGLNDVFIPVGKSIASIRLMIFDRWGEALYETTDMEMGWDGTYRGEVVKNDMYVWRLTYKFYTDEHGTIGMEQQQMGQVQVLR